MIHLDTNFLILALVPGSEQDRQLRDWLVANEPINISAIAWSEFCCGPLDPDHSRLAATLFPRPEPFTSDDGARAAVLFNATGRRRGSLLDCMIAATALRANAAIATENISNFDRFRDAGLRRATA